MASDDLKKNFDKAMVQIFVRAEREANYRATSYLQMLTDYGGLLTAKKLIAPGSKVSDGYTALWERQRLDLTVEALVVQRPWIALFTADEVTNARKRLKAYNADIKIIAPDDDSAKTPQRVEWSAEDVQKCVAAYFEMLSKIHRGDSVDKASMIRDLSKATAGHSEGSVRNLLQNISYELDQRGLVTAPGIGGLANSSKLTKATVEAYLATMFTANTDEEIQQKEQQVRYLIRPDRPPTGNIKPEKKELSGRSYYVRDLHVALYVKTIAEGKCELCDQQAPFEGRDGEPFLEVHHVKTLASGGPDIPSNSVALCPNCHRAVHHSSKSDELQKSLYSKVKRLVRL